jgi:hypothetical protein
VPLFASPAWRSAVILVLYGYQGVVAGFAMTALPNWHAAGGASLAEIGAYLALTGLPWTLQPLWGPVVDRFGGFRAGPRRFWILLGLAGAVASLIAVALAGAGDLARIAPLLLLHNAFAALVDTAVDGLMIDRVPADRLGQVTALTRVGFTGGTALGAALFAWALPAIGAGPAPWLLPLFALAAAMMVVAVREAPGGDLLSFRRHAVAGASIAVMLHDLLAELLRGETLRLIGFCVAVEFVIGAFGVRLAVGMVQEGGWDAAEVSRIQGGIALLGGTAGALLVAAWVDRAGPFRALVALLALCAACHAGAGLLLAGGAPPLAWAASLSISALSPALFFVALAPAVMLESRGEAAATRFALYMAALNLGTVAGAAAAPRIGALLDPPAMGFAAAAVLGAAVMLALGGVVPIRSDQAPGPAQTRRGT